MKKNKTNINSDTRILKNYTQTIENTELLMWKFLHI